MATAEARALVAEAEASFPSTPSEYLDVVEAQDLMIYYAFTGNAEKAAEWLHEAFDRSPVPIDPRIIESPLMAPVRAEVAFASAYDARREAAHDRVNTDRQLNLARLRAREVG